MIHVTVLAVMLSPQYLLYRGTGWWKIQHHCWTNIRVITIRVITTECHTGLWTWSSRQGIVEDLQASGTSASSAIKHAGRICYSVSTDLSLWVPNDHTCTRSTISLVEWGIYIHLHPPLRRRIPLNLSGEFWHVIALPRWFSCQAHPLIIVKTRICPALHKWVKVA